MLSDITPLLRRVILGENLSARETEQMFKTLLLEDTEGYYWVACTAALHTKGETTEELLGFVKSFDGLVEKPEPKVSVHDIIDIGDTGGDALKTINVSTTASFVLAAAGAVVAKQAAWGWTGPSGSADIFAMLGIDLAQIDRARLEYVLETVGICPYNRDYFSPQMKNVMAWKKKIKQIGLLYQSPFHIASFVYSPVAMTNRVYGCYSEALFPKVIVLFQELGYERVLLVHGVGGIDEVSTIGPTKVCELSKGVISYYELTPEDMGLRQASFQDIQGVSKEQNEQDFLRILKGKESGPKRDLVLANAAAGLYVAGKAATMKEGVDMARSTIESGAAWKKLNEFVSAFGGTIK